MKQRLTFFLSPQTVADKSALVRSLLVCAASQYTPQDEKALDHHQTHHQKHQQVQELTAEAKEERKLILQKVSLAVWIVDSLLDTDQPFPELYSAALYDRLVDAFSVSSGSECEMIATLLTRLLQQRSKFSTYETKLLLLPSQKS